jgi:hypothetical protein
LSFSEIDPTRIQGTLVYAAAAVACLRVGRGAALGNGAPPRLWRALAVTYIVLLVDLQFSIRFLFKDVYTDIANYLDVYGSRLVLQVPALLLFAGLVLAVVVAIRRMRSTAGQKLAILGTSVSVSCIPLELISLHRIDRVLYAEVWPSTAIAWLWTVGGLAVVVGAWREQTPQGQEPRLGS